MSISGEIILPNSLDQRTGEELKNLILENFNLNKPLVLNLSEVERIGTIGIQILLSSYKLYAQSGHSFSITNPTENFTEVLKDLGLQNSFKEWGILT